MAEMIWLARVHFDGLGTLDLRHDWKWYARGGDEVFALYATHANLMTPIGYQYTPADGQPGAFLASRVARALDGVVELPPSDYQPGAIY